MKKVLYISAVYNKDSFFEDQRNTYTNVDNYYITNKKNTITKLIIGLGYYIYSPLLFLVYGDWKHHIKEYDLLITDSRRAAKYIAEIFPKKYGIRTIVWYWNKMSDKELEPEFCRNHGCETWTFDKKDAKKYGMEFNDTYSFKKLMACDTEINLDCYYLGGIKPGRLELLQQIESVCNSNDLLMDYCIVDPLSQESNPHIQKEWVTYKDYLARISKSRCIIEINDSDQSGLTQRAIEALMMKKKLITNNRDICNYKVYNSDNVFIIGKDGINQLPNFIRKNYNEITSDVREYYDFGNWLDRIINSK